VRRCRGLMPVIASDASTVKNAAITADRGEIAASPVIASAAKQSTSRKERMDCFVAAPVIGRAFARPGGSSQ
jgi:hypothetical protein